MNLSGRKSVYDSLALHSKLQAPTHSFVDVMGWRLRKWLGVGSNRFLIAPLGMRPINSLRALYHPGGKLIATKDTFSGLAMLTCLGSFLEDVVAPGIYLEINWHGIKSATCSLILIDTLEKDRKQPRNRVEVKKEKKKKNSYFNKLCYTFSRNWGIEGSKDSVLQLSLWWPIIWRFVPFDSRKQVWMLLKYPRHKTSLYTIFVDCPQARPLHLGMATLHFLLERVRRILSRLQCRQIRPWFCRSSLVFHEWFTSYFPDWCPVHSQTVT